MSKAWNVLLGMVVEADMIVTFKRLLDRHRDLKGMEGYGTCASRKEFVLTSCSAHCAPKAFSCALLPFYVHCCSFKKHLLTALGILCASLVTILQAGYSGLSLFILTPIPLSSSRPYPSPSPTVRRPSRTQPPLSG